MKRLILFLIGIIIIVSTGNAFAKYSGGTGEPNNPYQVGTKADLLALAADAGDYGKCFILTADVNMEGQVFTTAIIAHDTDPNATFHGTAFTGMFDGNGHKITNFTIDGGSNCFIGLFGQADSGSLLNNIAVENFSINGYHTVGGLVGYRKGATIKNCYSAGTVTGTSNSINSTSIGGLIGLSATFGGAISNCYSECSVSGFSYVGGLVGMNNAGSIWNCYSDGTVSGYANSQYLGERLGGLVGYNNGYIENSYSSGSVSGYRYVGGLCGYNSFYGYTVKCYSTGLVNGSQYVGGLMGSSGSGYISGNFWDTQTSGQSEGVGIGSSTGVYGKTTELMKILLTFTSEPSNWDFTNEAVNGTYDFWRMCTNGVNYPHLSWESSKGDLACPNGVDMEDLSHFAERWLFINCSQTNNCGGSDMNISGTVDFTDFAILAENCLSNQ